MFDIKKQCYLLVINLSQWLSQAKKCFFLPLIHYKKNIVLPPTLTKCRRREANSAIEFTDVIEYIFIMKKLPIGISTLRDIIDGGYVYVDKTFHALKLISEGKYYFLSRPRRFGKSLFLDTLKEIFYGNKELFKGLYIYDKYDFDKHPVIRISFNDGKFTYKETLTDSMFKILKLNEKNLGISCSETKYPSFCFEDLIIKAYEHYGKQVVILIDEYDKPILDNIENTEIAKEMREELKNFYSVIKGADEYIRFAFLTGVSKFSKVSLFSGLNNLNDITVDKNYATICGYTQNDLETSFAEHLRGQDFDKIREWYNGYSWLGDSVYNPFDILLFIQKGFVYDNYWFSTATPTFLLKLIEKNQYFLPNLENIVADSTLLDSFDVDNIRLETLMWQTGYLTISEYFEGAKGLKYRLALPNREVQISLFSHIANYITKNYQSELEQENIYSALVSFDFDKLEQNIKALFASIPYNLFTNNRMHEYEGYYVSVFYAYLKALGIKIIAEDVTNKGRIDLTLNLPNAIYVIEFKTDGRDALSQIKSKNYHEKYLSENKPIYLIGIEFDTAERNISNIAWEKVK